MLAVKESDKLIHGMPTTTNAEIQAQQLPLFFWQNPVKHIADLLIQLIAMDQMAKTEHSHPLGMVVSTHFRCGKGVKRGLKNGALPFNID